MSTTKNTTKQIKKLTIEITDEKALAEAFPEVMRQVTEFKPDREALRPIVKAMYGIGRQVPGVRAYYSFEEDGSQDGDAAPETAQTDAKEPGEASWDAEAASGRSKAKGAA